ncbi:hypothetical protein DY000_02046468 [Brassica cretica]|uniref:Uncharacterized protein n=1 Tax=Brassica cretica TaxID=69181 RepID=A0ABQ7F6G3_BRACR|nr:hypothetical protein DY000_02046468 [Brassica cretica]
MMMFDPTEMMLDPTEMMLDPFGRRRLNHHQSLLKMGVTLAAEETFLFFFEQFDRVFEDHIRGLMSDAMILPCGHTFGAGGMEQVKQMVRSFIITITQFGLASTPSMFSCTLTEDESFLCPADGAIMITCILIDLGFYNKSPAVDSSGREFNRNRFIALLSAIVLEQIRVSGFGGCFFSDFLSTTLFFLLTLSLHLASPAPLGIARGLTMLPSSPLPLRRGPLVMCLNLWCRRTHFVALSTVLLRVRGFVSRLSATGSTTRIFFPLVKVTPLPTSKSPRRRGSYTSPLAIIDSKVNWVCCV